MKLLLLYSCVLVLVLGSVDCDTGDGEMLIKTLDALTRALFYLKHKISKINLDAVFCARKVQEQLESYLTHQPEIFLKVRRWLEVLRNIAKEIADDGIRYVYIDDPTYAKHVGPMASASKQVAWYPSQTTSSEYVVNAANCSVYFYEDRRENDCYHQMTRNTRNECRLEPYCYDLNEQYELRAYGLTHQVLFWQAMESHKCVDSVSDERRMRLCSNVLRDVKFAAAAGFPDTHVDLIMEQVGLCGFWGFSEFNNPEYLEKILEWQDDCGCYKNTGYYVCFDEVPEETHTRVKRREKRLGDGCYFHETAVATMALVVNVRFEAEKLYQVTTENVNELNKLLN